MAWLGKVSLGGFSDLAGAVTKLSESVKNIEKNFDSALGLEDRQESSSEGIWPLASDRKALFDPVMAFMGHRASDSKVEGSSDHPSPSQEDADVVPPSGNRDIPEVSSPTEKDSPSLELSSVAISRKVASSEDNEGSNKKKEESVSQETETALFIVDAETQIADSEGTSQDESTSSIDDHGNITAKDSVKSSQQGREAELEPTHESISEETIPTSSCAAVQMESNADPITEELHVVSNAQGVQEKLEIEAEKTVEKSTSEHELQDNNSQVAFETETPDFVSDNLSKNQSLDDFPKDQLSNSLSAMETPVKFDSSISTNHEVSFVKLVEANFEGQHQKSDSKEQLDPGTYVPKTLDCSIELKKVNEEMKMMEAALQGAARQAQAKADEIAKLMNENELLKSTIEDLKKKSTEAENEALRDEYHQRVSSLERKVYALTRERDTLRREQNKKSDVTALLKEKDEIISQVMAEGENLSKKQAAQEATIRKLRAQIRELEEEKQRLNSKLQVEETKVESIKRDKAATEKLLQETIEKNQVDLAAQKEFYTNALNAAKEAEAVAEARANNEAKVELENRLTEAAEREAMLVQTLEELRQMLSRTERQAVFKEDMLQRDINDLQQRYQASELRYNELITQVPESTRPLLRQIEAMQETAARKAEAWAGVEANLNSRLEAAEAKAAGCEEKERLMNDRLSQTLSRMTILETQIACLRTEQTQLSRSLEKERQRASESRQEYLAAMEEVATHEGRTKQYEDEVRELRAKYKQELQEVLVHKELLEKELERERATRLELERTSHIGTHIVDHNPTEVHAKSYAENGNVSVGKLSSTGSVSSMEESFFLQASLDSAETIFSDRRITGEVSPYFLKSMTPSAFEAALRQKDGELASYISRLASLEAIRDSLAEELVKMTAQCEKLRAEAALVRGLRAELEALRRRHSSALELMGERDEELEELRADILDLKEMYREQVDLLVNKIHMMSSSTSSV